MTRSASDFVEIFTATSSPCTVTFLSGTPEIVEIACSYPILISESKIAVFGKPDGTPFETIVDLEPA